MAAEIHRLVGEVLQKLEHAHKDRRLLEGMEELLAGYLEQTAAGTDTEPMEAEQTALPAAGVTEPDAAPALPALAGPEAVTLQEIAIERRPLAPAPPEPAGNTVGEQEPPAATASPEQERIRLAGRLGAAPSFRRTPKGSLVGSFPLGVHRDETGTDITDWHTVLTFAQRAEKLQQAKLARGQSAEVIGYKHVRQGRSKPGQPPKLIAEIYAVAVKAK